MPPNFSPPHPPPPLGVRGGEVRSCLKTKIKKGRQGSNIYIGGLLRLRLSVKLMRAGGLKRTESSRQYIRTVKETWCLHQGIFR